jgi:hypothetical protein
MIRIGILQFLKALAMILNTAQIAALVYFLAVYSTDNFPFFTFLIAVPLVNLSVLAVFTNIDHGA